MKKNTSRRGFIATTGIATAGLTLGATGVKASTYNLINKDFTSEPHIAGQQASKIYFFTKLLDNYESDFIAETLAMTGVDGFDLTVRPSGKVEPEKVTDDLPKFVEIGKKYKLETGLMVTAINGTEDKNTEKVLKTASSVGIKHYRLGYYNYDYSVGIIKTLENIKIRLKSLSEMNRRYNIQAGYQNHAGTRVGGPVWDLWELLKDFPVNTISTQFDVRHAAVEGSASWIIALHLLSRNIGSLAIKDFTWQVDKGKARALNVPLGEGIVDFNMFFKTIKELNINVPFTLHVEYPLLDKTEEGLSLLEQQKIIVGKVKKDVQFMRGMMMKY